MTAVLAALLVTAGAVVAATRDGLDGKQSGQDGRQSEGAPSTVAASASDARAGEAMGRPDAASGIDWLRFVSLVASERASTTDRISAVAAIVEQPRRFGLENASGLDAPVTLPADHNGGLAGGDLAGRTITIDAGHAANPDSGYEATGPGSSETKVKDPGGTSGVVTGQPEYMVNLSLAINLKQQLEAAGATVIMTRAQDSFDGGNIERAGIANSAGSDLFIRIHCDGSTNQGTHGASTLYPANIAGWTDDIYAASYQAALAVQAGLVAATGALDNGVVERSDMTGFNWADIPVILVEAGYLTNPAEDAALATPDYQQLVARGLTEGIRTFFQ